MRTTGLVLLASVMLFVAVGIASVISIEQQSRDAEYVEHTHEVLEGLEMLYRLAIDARRDAVAFVATGDAQRLAVFDRARRDAEVAVTRLDDLTRDNSDQQTRLRNIRVLLGQESAEQMRVLALRNTNPEAALAELRSSAWVGRFDRLQAAIEQMKAEEQRLLAIRNEREDASVARSKAIVIGGDALAFALATAAFSISVRQVRERRRSELQLAGANRELTDRVSDLQQRSKELTLLTQLGELLQSCENADEASGVIRQVLPKLFPDSHGAVYGIVPSRNLVVPVTAWPEEAQEHAPFAPTECWALRRGAMHEVVRGGVSVVCRHASLEGAARLVCVPMLAHGEAIGLLHLSWASAVQASNDLAIAVSEQLGLAQANLSLQETLRRMAVRDALTGVFNRRYMEETLTREIYRAMRRRSVLSLMILDLDHFKEYNDTFGHFAGDDLLRRVAAIMQNGVRADDVVCRYGGDEFVIIMPEADPQIVTARAESLLEQMKQLPRGDVAFGPVVTVSIGIATYPADAEEAKELLLAADRALYQAKRAGRARVVRAAEAIVT